MSVFADFCAAGLWPGLGRMAPETLAEAGIHGPDDVTKERLLALPRVGERRADRLLSGWIGVGQTYDVAMLLGAAGMPVGMSGRAVDVIGDDAAARLADDPWLLLDLPEVELAQADRFAVATVEGVRRDDPRRGRAVVVRALQRAAREGHTAVPVEDIGMALAQAEVADPAAAVTSACEERAVVAVSMPASAAGSASAVPTAASAAESASAALDDVAGLALERYAAAEEAVAEGIAELLDAAEPVKAAVDDKSLDEAQRRAVEVALTHGVSILTGGPGTGKSHTMKALVEAANRAGKTVALAAPTGRAAKRLAELTDADASTLHRLLGAQATPPHRGPVFTRGPAYPVEADIVVVDETSMLDVELAAGLVEACAPGTHVLLVGDAAQLPSIGPGRVLADAIESGVVPVTELTTLYRQAEGGAIARLATAVREGELPAVDRTDREVVVVPAQSSGEAAHRVRQLVTDSIPRVFAIDAGQVQVVTPVHRGPAGTIELNRVLKAHFNPGDGAVRGFDVGDRVVATANHLDAEPTGYANGEIGVVTAAKGSELTVDFASGPATVIGRALGDLVHGWAITVHRAQGSEWPAVIVVLPPEAGRMLSRPLVYTALTRARRHVSIVHAVGSALPHAVRRVGARPRQTRLRDVLAEAVPQ